MAQQFAKFIKELFIIIVKYFTVILHAAGEALRTVESVQVIMKKCCES